jgi:G3E family GTPase
LVSAQVKQADLIVMSKSAANPEFQLNTLLPSVDANDEDAVEIVLGWQGTNDSAETGFGDVAPKFFTQTWRCQESLSVEKLIQRLDALPTSVQRVKGFVATNAGVVEIQRVGADTQITPWQSLSPPDHLGLVFISHAAENLASLGWAD